MEEAYESALDSASLEAYEGQYTAEELCTMVDRAETIRRAFEQIKAA